MYNKLNIQRERHFSKKTKYYKPEVTIKRRETHRQPKLSNVKETKQNFNEELSYDHQPKKDYTCSWNFKEFLFVSIFYWQIYTVSWIVQSYTQSYTQFLIQVEVIGAIDDDDDDDDDEGSLWYLFYIYKYINLYVLCDCLCF